MPKDRFSIVFSNFRSELSSDLTGAYRLECVHQAAWLDVGVCIHQEVDVIRFTIKLDQLAVGVSADPIKVLTESCQGLLVQYLPSVLRNKNYVVVDTKYTMCISS